MSQPVLEVKNLTKRFGGLVAVDDLSFQVSEGETLGVIGPNGAGKSTTFNLITGIHHADQGSIHLHGHSILGLSPDQVCKKGLGRTFQVTRPFGNMTVLDNVITGAFLKTASLRRAEAKAREMIDFVGLARKVDTRANTLSIIDQRRLEFARALATDPRLLLLDEVLAGLNASETDEAIELIRKSSQAGITLIVIEHVMKVIRSISDRVLVLNYGAKLAEGTPGDVLSNPSVIEAYLGKGFGRQHA